MMLAMIRVPQTQEVLHTGLTGMTVRHHANDRVPGSPAIVSVDYAIGMPANWLRDVVNKVLFDSNSN